MFQGGWLFLQNDPPGNEGLHIPPFHGKETENHRLKSVPAGVFVGNILPVPSRKKISDLPEIFLENAWTISSHAKECTKKMEEK